MKADPVKELKATSKARTRAQARLETLTSRRADQAAAVDALRARLAETRKAALDRLREGATDDRAALLVQADHLEQVDLPDGETALADLDSAVATVRVELADLDEKIAWSQVAVYSTARAEITRRWQARLKEVAGELASLARLDRVLAPRCHGPQTPAFLAFGAGEVAFCNTWPDRSGVAMFNAAFREDHDLVEPVTDERLIERCAGLLESSPEGA